MDEFLKTYGPILTAALALIISWRSYTLSRRNEKRALASAKPIVSATVSTPDSAGWFLVELKIENRANHGFRGHSVEILWPLFSQGLGFSSAYEPSGSGEYRPKDPLPLHLATHTIPVRFEISKAGISGRPYGHSVDEKHYETIFVHVSRKWFDYKVLRLRVNLVSLEGLEKTVSIPVRRLLPQPP